MLTPSQIGVRIPGAAKRHVNHLKSMLEVVVGTFLLSRL